MDMEMADMYAQFSLTHCHHTEMCIKDVLNKIIADTCVAVVHNKDYPTPLGLAH